MTYEQAARDFMECYYDKNRVSSEKEFEELIKFKAFTLEYKGECRIPKGMAIVDRDMHLIYDADVGLFQAK